MGPMNAPHHHHHTHTALTWGSPDCLYPVLQCLANGAIVAGCTKCKTPREELVASQPKHLNKLKQLQIQKL